MAEFRFTVEATSAAPPDTVFAVLADVPRWKDWAGPMIRESSWDREGNPPPGGVGAVRKLGAKPVYAYEEIVEYDQPRHLAYTIRSGQPVRNHRADVELTAVDGGTHIRWSSTFEPKVAGTGSALRWFLRKVVSGLARRLARYAERDSS